MPRTPIALLIAGSLLVTSACRTEDPPKEDTGPDTELQDSDGDGWLDEDDCAPEDPTINPDATEVCDELDNDCDGEIDEDATDATTWHYDADGDGYGDPVDTVTACEQPEGTTSEDLALDCDDDNPDEYPGAPELCDGIDNDCDGEVDEDAIDAQSWYTDADGDGYGDPRSTTTACEPPSGYLEAGLASDCDDGDAAINPDATETCDGVDNDCDGSTDEDDAADASTWYADTDADGFGDATSTTTACDEPSGYSSDSTDCDDTDPTIHPGASETWYDGVDSDCAGDDDDDADGDGDAHEDYGGTDCDDTDPTRYGGVDCRPATTATHAEASTLTSAAPSCSSDFFIDADGLAYISTVISGTDYVYVIDETGSTTTLTGYSNYNMGGVATDPVTGLVVVGYNSYNGFGYQSGSSLPYVASGTASTSPLWTNAYAAGSPTSIAMDSAGCVWMTNWGGSGDISCVDTAGSATSMATLSGRLESVALDADEELYVSVGTEVAHVDTSTGTTTVVYTAGDDILDMAFDYNGDLYVETVAGEVELSPGDGGAASVFDTVSGQGRLAVSPEGWLVRMEIGTYSTHCIGAPTFTEWELDS